MCGSAYFMKRPVGLDTSSFQRHRMMQIKQSYNKKKSAGSWHEKKEMLAEQQQERFEKQKQKPSAPVHKLPVAPAKLPVDKLYRPEISLPMDTGVLITKNQAQDLKARKEEINQLLITSRLTKDARKALILELGAIDKQLGIKSKETLYNTKIGPAVEHQLPDIVIIDEEPKKAIVVDVETGNATIAATTSEIIKPFIPEGSELIEEQEEATEQPIKKAKKRQWIWLAIIGVLVGVLILKK